MIHRVTYDHSEIQPGYDVGQHKGLSAGRGALAPGWLVRWPSSCIVERKARYRVEDKMKCPA